MNAILICLVLASAPPDNEYRVDVQRVVDGDTVIGDVRLGFQVTLSAQSIRLVGFDAWEISRTRQTVAVTDAEIEKGKAAKVVLTELLSKHPDRIYLRLKGSGRGVYNRLTGWLLIYPRQGEPIRVDEFMRANGADRDIPEEEP